MFKDKADILLEIAKLHDFRKNGYLRYEILLSTPGGGLNKPTDMEGSVDLIIFERPGQKLFVTDRKPIIKYFPERKTLKRYRLYI